MASVGKIARRSFLVGSAAIVGGVAFGVYYLNAPSENPLKAGKGETVLNPYVFIDANGITIITPRAEMGQGVHTTLASLVAEEMDVDLEDITTLHGPPAQAYYNTAFAGAILPIKEYEKSDFMHGVSAQLGKLGKVGSLQITGGSTSMVDGYKKMRYAGASARETLKAAAANRLGVSARSLKTESGHVIARDGTKLSYVELAPLTRGIKPIQADLRDASEWKALGKPAKRVDILGKSTGTAEFSVDVRLEGMKFAALRRNPHLGGAMKGFDPAAALEMPGVEKVVDLGDGIAVVANNTWIAMQAAEAVDVDWGPAAHPATMDEVFGTIEAAFDQDANSTMRDDGDVSVVPDGATEVTAEYRLPYLAHATMEPMNATALLTDKGLQIWTGNQGPVITQQKCAEAVGLEPEQVTVHTTYMGGGFGRRGEFDYSFYAAKLAGEMKDVPVILTWSREEDMRHDFYRPGVIGRYRGAVKDGRAVMLDGAVAGQSSVRQTMARWMGVPVAGPDKAHVEGNFDQPYDIPNYRIRGYLAELDLPVGFWRSVGASFNGFLHDTFVDELAHAAGRDPLEFRLDMMRQEHAPSAAVLEAVKEMSQWTGQTPQGVGRGVGFTFSFGTPTAQVIEVVDEDGTIRINRAWIAADVGQILDPGIVETQLIGGMIYGLSAAVHGQITFENGAVEQENFPDYDAMRMHNTPQTSVRILETKKHISGVGEPGTPPSMPALGNALFDLTGQRARQLPLIEQFDILT